MHEIREAQLTCAEEWIQIPFAIMAPEMGSGVSHQLMTLMALNDVIDSLLEQRRYVTAQNEFVKIARSELYNPDFRHLYQEMGKEKCLQAFEAFVFQEGWKLLIYADGTKELYKGENDQIVSDNHLIERLFEKVKRCITVCKI